MSSGHAGQGRRPGGHRARDERRDAAAAAAGRGSSSPTPTMRRIIGDFDPILDALIDQRALIAFADKYGFPLSKRLIDAEIAQIPGDQGPQRPVQRAGLPGVPRAAAADRRAGPRDPRRRAAPAAAADSGRDQRPRSGRHGDALCVDAARSSAKAKPRSSRSSRSRPGSSRPTRSSSNIMRPTARATWSPSSACCGSRGSGPEQVAGRRRVRPGNRGLLQCEQGDLRAKRHAFAEPGRGPGPGDGERDRRSAPRAARRSPPRPRRRAPMPP